MGYLALNLEKKNQFWSNDRSFILANFNLDSKKGSNIHSIIRKIGNYFIYKKIILADLNLGKIIQIKKEKIIPFCSMERRTRWVFNLKM